MSVETYGCTYCDWSTNDEADMWDHAENAHLDDV